jgi:hypothetical protein
VKSANWVLGRGRKGRRVGQGRNEAAGGEVMSSVKSHTECVYVPWGLRSSEGRFLLGMLRIDTGKTEPLPIL